MDFILQGDFQPYFTALQQRLAILYSSELKGSSGEDETEILRFLWFLLGSIRSSFTNEIELGSRISCFERLAVCLNHLFENLGTLQPEWYHDNHNTWMHQSFKIVSFCKSAVLECYFWICRSCAKEEVRAHLSSVEHEQELRLFQDAMNMLKGHALSLMEELLKLVGDCPTLMALPSFCSACTDGSRLEPNTVVLGLWRKVMHIFDDFPHQAAGAEKQVKDFWATFNDTILGLTSLPSFQENTEENPDEVTSRSSEGTKSLVLNEFRWEMLFRLIPLHLFDEEGKFKQQSSTSSNQFQWLFNYGWATTKNWLLVEALIERSPLGLRADGDELNFQATKMMTTSLKWDISRLKRAILMRCIELAEFWGTNEHLVALLWQYFRVHYQPMNQEDNFSELVVQRVLECPISVAYKFYQIGQYSSEFELFLKLLLTELKKTGCPKRIHKVRKRLLEGLSTPITNPTTLQQVLTLELVFAHFMNHEYKLAQLPHALQLYSSGSNTECQRIVTRALFIAALMLLQTSQDIKNWAERYLLEPFETVCKDYVDLQMRLKSLKRENKGIPSHLEDELQKTESLLYKLLHHMEMMFRLRHSRDSLCSDYVLISPSLKHLVQHLDLLSESIAIRLLDVIHYSMQLKKEQSSPDLSATQPPIITPPSVDNGSEEDDPFSFMDGIAFEDLDRMVEEHRAKQQNYPIANQIYAHLFDPLISAITKRLPVHILERSVTCLASMAPLLVHFKFCQWSHLKALYSNSFMVRSNADVSQRSIPIWFWVHILRAQHAESLCIKPCIKEFILEYKFFLLNIWLLSTIERSHYEPLLIKQLQNTPTIPYFQNMHGVKKVAYIVKHVMECLSEEWQQANKACGETPTSVAAVKQQFMEVTSHVHLVIHRSVADRLEQKEGPQLQRFIALMYSIIGNLFVYLPELLYTKGNANHNTLAALLNGYFFGPFHSTAPVGGMALPLRERNTMLLQEQHVGRSFGRYRGSSIQSGFSQARSQEDISLLNAQRQLLTKLYQNAVWGFVQSIPVCLAHFDLHGDGFMSRSLAQFFACFYEGLYQQFALHFDYKELDGLDITKRPSVPARLDELVKGMLIRGDRTQRKGLGSLRRFVMGTVVPMFLRIPLDKNFDGHGAQAVFAALQSPLFVIFTIRFVERLECLSSCESTPAKTDQVQNDDVVLATTRHGWHHLFLDFLPIMLPLLEVFTFTSSSFDRAPVHLMKSEAYHLAALLFRTLGEADAKELQQQQEGCIGMDGKTNAHWQILQHFACCLLLHIVRDVYLLWKGEQFFQNCQSLESLRMRLDDEKEQLARLLSSSSSPGSSSFTQQYADIRKGIQGDANQRQLLLSSPLFGPHSYYQYTQPIWSEKLLATMIAELLPRLNVDWLGSTVVETYHHIKVMLEECVGESQQTAGGAHGGRSSGGCGGLRIPFQLAQVLADADRPDYLPTNKQEQIS